MPGHQKNLQVLCDLYQNFETAMLNRFMHFSLAFQIEIFRKTKCSYIVDRESIGNLFIIGIPHLFKNRD